MIFFAKENVLNCIKAARWCSDNKLYQQATTLLREGLTTWLCCHYKLDYNNSHDRDVFSACIKQLIPKNKQTEHVESTLVNKEVIDKILSDTSVWGNKKLVTVLQTIGPLRNNYNHAGFNDGNYDSQKIIEQITKLLDGLEEVLAEI